jgi:hypothetical protein
MNVTQRLAGHTKSHAGGNSASTNLECEKECMDSAFAADSYLPQNVVVNMFLQGRVVSVSIEAGGCCLKKMDLP